MFFDVEAFSMEDGTPALKAIHVSVGEELQEMEVDIYIYS